MLYILQDDYSRFVPEKKEHTHADQARELVAQFGAKFSTKVIYVKFILSCNLIAERNGLRH